MHLCSMSMKIICDRAICDNTVPDCNSRCITWISHLFTRVREGSKIMQIKTLEFDCSDLLHCQAHTRQQRNLWGLYPAAFHYAMSEGIYEIVPTKNDNEEVNFIRFRRPHDLPTSILAREERTGCQRPANGSVRRSAVDSNSDAER